MATLIHWLFLSGDAFKRWDENDKPHDKKKVSGISDSVCECDLAVYLLHVTADRFVLSPNSYYGKWYYSLWLVSLFCLLSLIRIEHVTLQRFIVRVSSNTLVVYLAPHLPTLYILSRLPLKSAGMAVVMIIVFFWCAQILAEGFRKMPLLRKLV